jgi:TrmH family RNA methyltransferase
MTTFSPLSQSMRKDIRALHKRSQRESEQVFLLEGEKLVNEALRCEASLREIVLPSRASEHALALAHRAAAIGVPVYETPERHFEALCDTKTPQGILAIADYPALVPDFTAPVVILDGIGDPGNVGTIIRTADWFGYRTVLLGPGCADRFHPKTLRSTMGSVFRVAILSSDSLSQDIARYMSRYTLYGATLDADSALEHIVPEQRHAVVLGSEAHGISREVQSLLTQPFLIPGNGGAESLNVAVAAGIALYYCSQQLQLRR